MADGKREGSNLPRGLNGVHDGDALNSLACPITSGFKRTYRILDGKRFEWLIESAFILLARDNTS
jgi:hypothetical protein